MNDKFDIDESDILSDLECMEDEGACPKYIDKFIVKLNTSNIKKILIDEDEFEDGVNSVSKLCGAISALTSVGITPDKAMDYVVDKEGAEAAMKHNIEICKIQQEASVKTAELGLVNKVDGI